MTGRRIACIFWPSLAIWNWSRRQRDWPDDRPLALTVEGSHGPVIHAINDAARQAGVQAGARASDMRAICPALWFEPANLAGDAALLLRLVHQARRWGPYSAPDGTDGLVVDTTGVAHLFGGETALLAEIIGHFAQAGLEVRVALAPTWGAAWALAHHGSGAEICDDFGVLDALPVAALRLSDRTCLLLRRLGLKQIGDLRAIARPALMRRFAGAELADHPLLRLDQALGRLPEPVNALRSAPVFQAVTRLPEPVFQVADVLPDLHHEICRQLQAQEQGCRLLRLSIFRTDGERRDLHLSCAAASRDADHLLWLWRDRLDHLDPGFGFDQVELTALVVEPLGGGQVALDSTPDQALELARLADRLLARFGDGHLSRQARFSSHIPERTEARVSVQARYSCASAGVERPLRMFSPAQEIKALYAIPDGPPLRFVWRRQVLAVSRFAGPERIAPEWWRAPSGTRLRDYFRIEDHHGRRLWIFREGLFDDGRGGAPRWFLHGVFS